MALLTVTLTTTDRQDKALARLLVRRNAEWTANLREPYKDLETLLPDLILEQIVDVACQQSRADQIAAFTTALDAADAKQIDAASAALGMVP